MSQALVRAKDEYGITLYQYLRDMGASLRFIKANSIHLGSLGGKNNKKNPKKYSVTTKTITLKAATRKGYKFAGWYRDKKLKRRVKKIRKGSTGKVTLYAKWIIAK